ncbi:hypothetical protein GCM10023108_38170 [Saccharopolyspora hordei]
MTRVRQRETDRERADPHPTGQPTPDPGPSQNTPPRRGKDLDNSTAGTKEGRRATNARHPWFASDLEITR